MSEVANKLQKMMQESKAFSIQMPNGDKLHFNQWANEKNYAICINRVNTNVYEKVGYIRHQAMDYFRSVMKEWFGGK